MSIQRDLRMRWGDRVRKWSAPCLIGAVLFLAGCATNAEAEDEYPIMRPDVDTYHAWLDRYYRAPAAVIDPIADWRIAAGAIAGIGSGFSLLDSLVYTPSERNQGSCGNCWVWVGTGLLELCLAEAGISDRLSIQFFNSCASLDCTASGCGTNASCACAGGDLEMFVEAYNALGYAIPWSNDGAQYQDKTYAVECGTAKVCGGITKSPRYVFGGTFRQSRITTTGVDQDTAINHIKNVLQQNKGVYCIFTLPNSSAWDDFNTFWKEGGQSELWDFSAYAGMNLEFTNGAGSHVVLVVGYNEEDADQAHHYWIALNSWGATSRRTDGTFRIKMHQGYDSTYSYTKNGYTYTSPVLQLETIDNVRFVEPITTDPSEDMEISSSAYAGTIDVLAADTTAWTAVFDASWVTITSSASGTGDGRIAFTASANTDSGLRTARLYINGEPAIRVIQEGTITQESTTKAKRPSDSSDGAGGMCFIAALGII